MGQGKKNKAGARRVKLPKRIAGVKVPKDLRRTVERVIAEAQSPAGREMVAAALSLAAASATAALVRARARQDRSGPGGSDAGPIPPPTPPRPPRPPVPPAAAMAEPPRPPRPLQGGTAADPQAVADALGQVAEQVLGRLFGGKR